MNVSVENETDTGFGLTAVLGILIGSVTCLMSIILVVALIFINRRFTLANQRQGKSREQKSNEHELLHDSETKTNPDIIPGTNTGKTDMEKRSHKSHSKSAIYIWEGVMIESIGFFTFLL